MIELNIEPLTAALIEEGRELLNQNWITSGSFDPELKLDPNFELYLMLAQRNRLLVATIRDNRRLAGYAVMTFGANLKHRTLKVAHGEAFYVEPELRRWAPKLLRRLERELHKLGITRAGWFVAEDSAADRFFRRHGFMKDEVVLEKRIDASDFAT